MPEAQELVSEPIECAIQEDMSRKLRPREVVALDESLLVVDLNRGFDPTDLHPRNPPEALPALALGKVFSSIALRVIESLGEFAIVVLPKLAHLDLGPQFRVVAPLDPENHLVNFGERSNPRPASAPEALFPELDLSATEKLHALAVDVFHERHSLHLLHPALIAEL